MGNRRQSFSFSLRLGCLFVVVGGVCNRLQPKKRTKRLNLYAYKLWTIIWEKKDESYVLYDSIIREHRGSMQCSAFC